MGWLPFLLASQQCQNTEEMKTPTPTTEKCPLALPFLHSSLGSCGTEALLTGSCHHYSKYHKQEPHVITEGFYSLEVLPINKPILSEHRKEPITRTQSESQATTLYMTLC